MVLVRRFVTLGGELFNSMLACVIGVDAVMTGMGARRIMLGAST